MKLTDLLAHLVEEEERRLHLEAACPSMLQFCVLRLGMSEDEACRQRGRRRGGAAARLRILEAALGAEDTVLLPVARKLGDPYLTSGNAEAAAVWVPRALHAAASRGRAMPS